MTRGGIQTLVWNFPHFFSILNTSLNWYSMLAWRVRDLLPPDLHSKTRQECFLSELNLNLYLKRVVGWLCHPWLSSEGYIILLSSQIFHTIINSRKKNFFSCAYRNLSNWVTKIPLLSYEEIHRTCKQHKTIQNVPTEKGRRTTRNCTR